MKRPGPCAKCGAFGAEVKKTEIVSASGTFYVYRVVGSCRHRAVKYSENTPGQAINLWNDWDGKRSKTFKQMLKDIK